MLSLIVVVALQAAPAKLAAPPWTSVKVEPELVSWFAEQFEQRLRGEGVELISARDLAALLGLERQKQLLGCAEEGASCAVELGSALGASALLTASVAHLGGVFRATFRVISTTDGRSLAQATAEGRDENAFVESFSGAAIMIAQALGVSRARSPALLWVSTAATGVFAVSSAIAFVVASLHLQQLDRELASARLVTRDAEAIARWGRTAEALGWTGAGLAVGAGLTALIVFFTRAPSSASAAWLSPLGAFAFTEVR